MCPFERKFVSRSKAQVITRSILSEKLRKELREKFRNCANGMKSHVVIIVYCFNLYEMTTQKLLFLHEKSFTRSKL